jgi:hypothetical protein
MQMGMKATRLRVAVLGALTAALIVPSAASARPSLFAASAQGECLAGQSVNGFLRANHANVLRVVLPPQDAPLGAGLACIRAAHSARYKIYLSLQFSNRWTPRQVAAYFARVLPTYARYVWAVGVGNEQDLPWTILRGQRPGGLTGKDYAVVWDAVEPVVARLAPRAIRAYGEFSPWSFAANRQGFAHRRPRGVQAIAAHCYHTKSGGISQIPAAAAWAASEGLPLWCSEMGPALPTNTTPPWVVPENWASWRRWVARIIARSPNLKMTSYYYYPSL